MKTKRSARPSQANPRDRRVAHPAPQLSANEEALAVAIAAAARLSNSRIVIAE
jgi:hypothetical protein